ncbi:RagB/SusD family nutrient uptake outer membrane protein [Danxiaibacter flavus]|uniref:RagB/SusD family nutrient uptake outer membrane protein n=1 Tax=Danxiaibacter flavus TaxID=3049108 RepID=A0ABV3ZI39_9BACT|nr:RagB/SusD family nutrient uptake outer membrane protein [Chitinophagaceae bacterium DXS]
MKKIFRYRFFTVMILTGILASSCKKGLDYNNPNAINASQVWTDPNLIKAFLTDIYGNSMPGWPLGSGVNTDESYSSPISNYLKGIVTASTTYTDLNYTNIDKCNYLMDQLAQVPASVLSTDLNKQYTGEAKFWRAWAYWGMVSQIGGVPLILHTQNQLDTASLKVPRNKTSECIAQMVKDLDSAALLLPSNFTGADYGRVTKVAAMGLKGRILLWYASPLFNPSNDQARWTSAYSACKAAVDEATTAGYGLTPNYNSIWYSGYSSSNPEPIMVNQYFYQDHYMNFAAIRPQPFTNGAADADDALWSLLKAFPKRDGTPMQADTNQLKSNPVYNQQFLTDFYTNRDDRFYATIFSGGTYYPTPDLFPSATQRLPYWGVYQWDAANSKYVCLVAQIAGVPASFGFGSTGFLNRKGLDTTLTGSNVVSGAAGAKSWWSPMRFAELLMNYGECANETGKANEALAVLYNIRKRAGIAAGVSGNYGITAASQSEIRTAYINERQVEFAYENFRFSDLRRWKRFDILNNQGNKNYSLVVALKPGQPLPASTSTILDPVVRSSFSAVVYNIGSTTDVYNLDLNHWFYALNPAQISIEPQNLPQNNEWGGSFDPLQ